MRGLIEEIRSRFERGQSPADILHEMNLSRPELIAAIWELEEAPTRLSEQAVMLEGESGPLCAVVSAEAGSVRVGLKTEPGWSIYVAGDAAMPTLAITGPEKAKLKLGDSKVYPSFSDHKPLSRKRNFELWSRISSENDEHE